MSGLADRAPDRTATPNRTAANAPVPEETKAGYVIYAGNAYEFHHWCFRTEFKMAVSHPVGKRWTWAKTLRRSPQGHHDRLPGGPDVSQSGGFLKNWGVPGKPQIGNAMCEYCIGAPFFIANRRRRL